MKTLVKPHQRQLNNGQVVNTETIERWIRQAKVAALIRPLRQQASRARKKREARIANRRMRREIAKLEWEKQNEAH